MTRRILENLTRQAQALKVLLLLHEEEFAHLREFRPQSVGALEFSIQELMRQILSERRNIRAMMAEINPAATRLRELSEVFGDSWPAMAERLEAIDALEQSTAKQAEKSYALALALFDQSSGYVEFFKKELTPKRLTYGPRGIIGQAKPDPALMRGAF